MDEAIEEVKLDLKRFHPVKDYGFAEKVLGIRIEQGDGHIRIDQEMYTKEILGEFGLENRW